MQQRRKAPITEKVFDKITKPVTVPITTGIIFSDTGLGKTYLTCTASKVSKLRSLIVTMDRYDETLPLFPDIDVLDLPGSVNGGIDIAMRALIKELRTSNKRWDFVGLDSVSKLMHLSKFELNHSEYAKDLKNVNLADWQKHDPDIPEQRDYLKITNRITDYLWDLRSIAIKKGFHLFVTAWERFEYVEDGNYTFYYPDMSPELGRLIIHEYGFCGRLTVKRKLIKGVKGGEKAKAVRERTLHLDAKNTRLKNRVGLPSSLINPSVAMMLGEVPVVAGIDEGEDLEETEEEETENGDQD